MANDKKVKKAIRETPNFFILANLSIQKLADEQVAALLSYFHPYTFIPCWLGQALDALTGAVFAVCFFAPPFLSPDLVVVPAAIFLGPAFLVSLVFTPLANFSACLAFSAPLPAPPLTSLLPGLSGDWLTLPFGCVPVLFGLLPRSPPSCISALL
jgi:hypothetical protein